MKHSRYALGAATAIIFPMLSGCDSMLDTSLNMSPVPGVNIGVGVSTPISGPWGDYSPWWGNGVLGSPVWNPGPWMTGGWHPGPGIGPRPPMRPGINGNIPVVPSRPVVPPAGVRPYPTGPGPVIGGSGIPALRPGAVTKPPVSAPPVSGGAFRRGANR